MGGELTGRVALVTGASSGLGWAFALQLARERAPVAVGVRRMEMLDALVGEIQKMGGDALAIELDVASASSVADGFTALTARWRAPDVVVANAGIGSQALATELATLACRTGQAFLNALTNYPPGPDAIISEEHEGAQGFCNYTAVLNGLAGHRPPATADVASLCVEDGLSTYIPVRRFDRPARQLAELEAVA